MRNSNKKGFTIVELVIVIAVIAVLASTVISIMTSVVEKANLSNDQMMIRQMNTTLAVESIPNGFKYAGDAVLALNGEGFVGKYSPFSADCHYAYSLENNQMYLLDRNGSVVFPKTSVNVNSLWGLYNNSNTDMIPGITKYVAISSITNEQMFNNSFNRESSYTIDLNKTTIEVHNSTGKEINIINGFALPELGITSGSSDTIELTVASSDAKADGEKTIDTIVYKNLMFDTFTSSQVSKATEATNVRFINCYFKGVTEFTLSAALGGYNVAQLTNNGAIELAQKYSVSYENCTFNYSGTGWMANLCLQEVVSDFIFDGCTFISTGRGINMTGSLYGGHYFGSFQAKDSNGNENTTYKITTDEHVKFNNCNITLPKTSVKNALIQLTGYFDFKNYAENNVSNSFIQINNCNVTANNILKLHSNFAQEYFVENSIGQIDDIPLFANKLLSGSNNVLSLVSNSYGDDTNVPGIWDDLGEACPNADIIVETINALNLK